MINPSLLSDSLVAQVASEVVRSKLENATVDYLANEITDSISKELLDVPLAYVEEMRRGLFFEKLFKSLVSHERKFASMIKGIWEEQRRIIIANLKKMKKEWLEKDVIDQILYPRKQFEVKIAEEAKELFEANMEERGNEELGKIEAELRKPRKQAPVGIAFDVENPEVQKWLNSYTPKLSKNLETVSTDKLRRGLIEGMKAGEGVPLLSKRINGTYDNWNKVRSEAIARSEAIRASNRGAIESYRQSGVVKSKIWITHLDKRTCPSCRRLDGKVIALEKNYFSKGDPAETITVEGTTQTFKNDYEDITAPPRHTRCRCSIAPSFEDMAVTRRVNLHKGLSAKEKEVIKGWTHRDYIYIRQYMTGSKAERLALKREWGDKIYNATKKKAKMMDDLFLKYKDGAANNAIYRGLNELDESVYNQFKNYKVGDTVEIDNAITSWTQSKEAVEQYSAGEYGIRFHLKKGRKLTKELDIDRYSFYGKEEMEVIIKDTRFKVTKIKESTHPQFKYQKRLDIYLEETGP